MKSGKNESLPGRASLNDIIEKRCLKPSKVAVELDMTRQQFNHIQKGRRRPTIEQALAIQDFFGIQVSEWVWRKEV